MGEVSKRLDAPYDGISQVAPQVALPTTCRDMVNCLARLPEGISKRPPLEWLKKVLTSTAHTDATSTRIPRGTDATDLMLVLNYETPHVVPRLFNWDTLTLLTTTISPEAQAYLDYGLSPQACLRVYTVEDTTFIVNRSVTILNGSDTQATRPNEALLWVKAGGYGKVYKVTVTPDVGTAVTASYSTGAGSEGGHALGANTDRIAKGLFDGTIPFPGSDGVSVSADHLDDLIAQGFTVTWSGSLVFISHATKNFTLEVSDDTGGTAMVGIKDSVQRFSDLPIVAHDGFVVRIAQKATGSNSDYYVQFNASGSTQTGIWEEVVAPGANLGLDPETMPIQMTTSDAGLTWDFEVAPWTTRTTGNETLVPDPDFIGDKVQAISWVRGRLALEYTQGVYLAASDSPFKFYPSTLSVAKDSDPIGMLNPAPTKGFFKDLAPFDKKLLFIGDGVQALLDGDSQVFTSENAGLVAVGDTKYHFPLAPQAVAGKAYWASPRPKARFLSVYALAVDRVSGETIPEDVTPAIPALLPIGLDRVTSCKELFTTVYGSSGGYTLYVNTFRHVDGERKQNGWQTWRIPTDWSLIDLSFRGTTLRFILREDATGHGHVFDMEMAPGYTDPLSDLIQYIDLRVNATGYFYDAEDDETTYTSPIPVHPDAILTLMAEAHPDYPEAFAPEVTSRSGNTITVKGDWSLSSPSEVYIGVPYTSYWDTSTFYVPNSEGFPRKDGRLTLRRLSLELSKFGYLRVEVNNHGRETFIREFAGYNLADAQTPLGSPPMRPTEETTVSLGGLNTNVTIRLINDSHLGFFLTGYEWKGQFSGQSQQV